MKQEEESFLHAITGKSFIVDQLFFPPRKSCTLVRVECSHSIFLRIRQAFDTLKTMLLNYAKFLEKFFLKALTSSLKISFTQLWCSKINFSSGASFQAVAVVACAPLCAYRQGIREINFNEAQRRENEEETSQQKKTTKQVEQNKNKTRRMKKVSPSTSCLMRG